MNRYRAADWQCKQDDTGEWVKYSDHLEAIKEIRTAIANFIGSEGCGCCEGSDHDKHHRKIAELLNVPFYDDSSGYDFGKFEEKQE